MNGITPSENIAASHFNTLPLILWKHAANVKR